MTNISVPIPPSLSAYRGHIREFVSGMIRKLDMNSHKNQPDNKDIEKLLAGVLRELSEFQDQLSDDKYDPNTLIELMDAANFLFLIFVSMRNTGTPTKLELWVNKYLNIDVEKGKIFCKETRGIGSQYKIGDEIKGSRRSNDYIDISLQKFRSHWGSSKIPRSHIIWWKATGKWPIGVIDHINNIKDDDRISNLRDVSFSENSLNRKNKNRKYPPYVTQYKPPGHTNLGGYGKFVYSKYYDGKNIRCAYYDTPEEAYEQGSKDWIEKIKKLEKEEI